jgi:hypothetical protein
MSDTDLLYTSGIEKENEKIKALLAQIRNYYSATPGWDLFEEDVDKLIGRKKPHDNAISGKLKVIPEFKYERKTSLCGGYCPSCCTPLEKSKRQNSCPNCGQKLDWSDVDENS